MPLCCLVTMGIGLDGIFNDKAVGSSIVLIGLSVFWILLMILLWRSIYTYLHVDKSGVTEKCPFRKSVEYPFSEFVDCGVVVYYDIPLIYLSKHVLTYGQKGGNRQQHDLIKWGEDALQLSYTKKAVRAIRTYAPPELYEMLCRDIERNPYIRKKYK